MATQILIKNVRVSYVFVFEPHGEQGKEKKFKCTPLIRKDDVQNLTAINDALKEAYATGVQTKWGGKSPAVFKNPLRDGDLKDLEKNPEYRNHMFINSNNTADKPPLKFLRDLSPTNDPSKIYSGCFANVLVSFYPFNRDGNVGIACSLQGIQFVSDGDRLANTFASASDFPVLEASTASAFQQEQPQFGQPQNVPTFGQPQFGQPQFGQPQNVPTFGGGQQNGNPFGGQG